MPTLDAPRLARLRAALASPSWVLCRFDNPMRADGGGAGVPPPPGVLAASRRLVGLLGTVESAAAVLGHFAGPGAVARDVPPGPCRFTGGHTHGLLGLEVGEHHPAGYLVRGSPWRAIDYHPSNERMVIR